MSRALALSGKFTPLCTQAGGNFGGSTGPYPLSQAEEINGRLLFTNVVCTDAKTLQPLLVISKMRSVDRKLGRCWYIYSPMGLYTTDTYSSPGTLRIPTATLLVVAATDLSIIGCKKLGSTWHFIYALKIDTTLWRLCHTSTTDFTNWSTPVPITVGGAARYTTEGSINRTQLFVVGNNLVLTGTYTVGLVEGIVTGSSGTTWTLTRTGTGALPVQADNGGRLYDYRVPTSAYTDDGSTWTNFNPPTPATGYNLPNNLFYAHGNFYISAAELVVGRALWKTPDLINVAFATTGILSNNGELGVQTANGLALAYAVTTGQMSLRYFQ